MVTVLVMVDPADRVAAAKVEHHGVALIVDEHVVRLDVESEDSQTVQHRNCVSDLPCPLLSERSGCLVRRLVQQDAQAYRRGTEAIINLFFYTYK